MEITIRDVIALICITGGLILTALQIDTYVGIMLSSIAFFYFGRKGDQEKVIKKIMKAQSTLGKQ